MTVGSNVVCQICDVPRPTVERKERTVRQPWKVTLTCSDCGASFDSASVNPSTGVIMGGPDQTQRQRLLLVKFFADCPACHNMRVAKPDVCTRSSLRMPPQPCTFDKGHKSCCSFTLGTNLTPCLCLRGEPCSDTCPCVYPQYKSICTRC